MIGNTKNLGGQQATSARGGARRAMRRGSLLSAELLLVFPVLMMGLLAMTQYGLLLASANSLQSAAATAARVCATTPGSADTNGWVICRPAHRNRVCAAAARSLRASLGAELAAKVRVTVVDRGFPGSLCTVRMTLQKSEAAPDLLGVFGIRLRGNLNVATTMMKD